MNEAHGRFFKWWGSVCVRRFPELPLISRCHNYKIRTKFTYKCGECGNEYGRHSKSIDTTKKVKGIIVIWNWNDQRR